MNQTITSYQTFNNFTANQANRYPFVPIRPSILPTDEQWRKIGLVATTAILGVGPMIAGQYLGGEAGLAVGKLIGVGGVTVALLSLISLWPNIDLQSAETARIVQYDFQTKSLDELHKKYSFSDLAKYGYLSMEMANKMESLHAQIWTDRPFDFKRRYTAEELATLREYNFQAYQQREKIEEEFNELRKIILLIF